MVLNCAANKIMARTWGFSARIANTTSHNFPQSWAEHGTAETWASLDQQMHLRNPSISISLASAMQESEKIRENLRPNLSGPVDDLTTAL